MCCSQSHCMCSMLSSKQVSMVNHCNGSYDLLLSENPKSPHIYVIRYEEIWDFLKEGGHSCRYNGSPLKLVLKIAWSTCSETVSNTQCGCAVTATPLHRYMVTPLHGYTVTRVHRYTGTPLHGYTVTPLHCVTRFHCYTVTRVHRYTGTPLHGYTVTRVHRYTVTRLHRYTVTPLHGYTVTLLHAFTVTRYTVTRLHCYYMGTPLP